MNITELAQTLNDKRERLEAKLAEGALDRDTAREYNTTLKILQPVEALQRLQISLADAEEMQSQGDAELRALAADEVRVLREQVAQAETILRDALIPKDEDDDKSAVLEIRAGTGGEEAALFAADLFRMYDRYASEKRWGVEIVSMSPADAGGYKEIIASITGDGVYARFKFESGVHRVQRVPDTEASGRVHTSAATVAVLPEAEETDVHIHDDDLRIDVYRASGAGGQHVNKTESAVRVTHMPSGIVVAMQEEKSQHKNKAKAMKILRAKLYDAERERLHSARAADRKAQVGSGDRSERIRTYNYPQGRVTDHRINFTTHDLPNVMEGGECLEKMIDALRTAERAALVAAQEI